MNNPLVTISIPIYKCEDFLQKCLKSVLAQTYKNIEVTLINDQTPDNSVSIAEGFIKKNNLQNSWRIYHLEENSGLSVVRNKGIDTAKGKYIFFLDSDDTITENCIEKLVEIAEKSGAEMTISQLECEQQSTGEKSICIPLRTKHAEIKVNKTILQEFSNGGLVSYGVNKLVKIDFLKKNNLYFIKGLFAQDELWTFHIVLKAEHIAIHKEVTYTYYLHGESVIHNRGKKHFDNWATIGQYIDKALRLETDLDRRRLILTYLINFKSITLIMNWKAQQNENLWKEQYAKYKKLSTLSLKDYFSSKFTNETKKKDFWTRFPARLGMYLFKKRYNG